MHYKLTTELTCRIAQTQNCLGLPVATKYAVFARSPHSHASTMGMLKKYFKKIKNMLLPHSFRRFPLEVAHHLRST